MTVKKDTPKEGKPTQQTKRPVGRPRSMGKISPRNILIREDSIDAARRLNSVNISAAIRQALIMYEHAQPPTMKDYSVEAYEAQFENARHRNVVLDERTMKIAASLGTKGNVSEGVRNALEMLKEDQKKKDAETT